MITQLTEWYRGVRMPVWGKPMLDFLTPSSGLLSTLLPTQVPVVFTNKTDTAYADRTNNLIVCGTSFFNEDPTKRLNSYASKEQTITFVLGLIAHEGSHFAWSPGTIPELLENGIPFNKATSFVANIVEDIYIEDKFIRTFPIMGWMIVGAWEYLFNDKMNEGKPQWDGLSVTNENIFDVLNTAVQWKHQYKQFPMRSALEQELFDLFMSVRGVDALWKRKQIITAIIKKLLLESSENQEDEGGESSEICKGKGKGRSGSPLDSDKMPEDGNFLTPDMVHVPADERKTITHNDKNESQKIINRNNGVVVEVGSINGKEFYVADRGKVETKSIKADAVWRRFGELARQRGAVRSVQGTPKASGKRLTHPVNIYTNGRVFSNTNITSTVGKIHSAPPQVIILIDSSGSMRQENRYKNALIAAYGAAEGMEAARMKFAIYGYTTTEAAVCITKIKSLEEHASLALKRIDRLYTSLHAMNNTPDFEAITFATRKFDVNGGDKVLVVISDGTPSYGSEESAFHNPIADVKELVKKVRSQGTHVFGLSVCRSSDAAVKEIYGDCAMFSSDPNSINKFLARFI